MFGNYSTMAHRHIQGDVGFFDARGDEEAFVKSKPPLSEEIIQSYNPPNPWTSSPKFEGDFVLVCEFSELEGPKPVMTIPNDSGGDFDQNDFALKIMSIDYSATNVVRSSGSFSLVDDIGVILEDPSESAFAYVHHFTLYDVIARGYVRPFCMAYITSDQRKIIRNLEWLMTKFGKVSEAFCFGNRYQFQRDMKHRLADLHYTMEEGQTRRGGKAADDRSGKAKHQTRHNYAALEKGLEEVQEILELLAKELVNPKLEAQFERLEKLSSVNSVFTPRRHHNSSSIHEGYHSDVEENSFNESHQNPFRRASTCDSLSDMQSSLDPAVSYTPQIIRVDGYRKFDIRLRTLHELCGWGYKLGLRRLRKLHKHLSRSPLILYMEQKESKLVDPASSLLTIGRAVTINFMQGSNLQSLSNGMGTQGETDSLNNMTVPSTLSPSSGSPSHDENSLMRQLSLSYEARFIPGTAYASLESLYYDVNESLDNNSDDDEDDKEHNDKMLITDCIFQTSDNGSWLDIHVDVSAQEYNYSSSTENSFKGKYPVRAGVATSDEVSNSPADRDTKCQDLPVYGKSSPSSSQGEQSQDRHSALSVCCNDSFIVRRQQKVSVGSYINRINSFNMYLPGSGIHNFLSQNSFAVDLVYALLSGRTVIVVASPLHEKNVTALIRTLWLFVPGHSSMHHLVVPWHTQPLCLLDLSRMKLIGFSRHKTTTPNIPTDVHNNCTILDYDTKQLMSPHYKGLHLNHLIKCCKQLRSDRAYIAFIHSYFLELAHKAFVYYHSFCVSHSTFQQTQGNDGSINSHMKKASIGYMRKLDVVDDDIDIIEYWVDMIKQQQVYLQVGSSIVSPPSVYTDFKQCKNYPV